MSTLQPRYLLTYIRRDLAKKMIFLGGPRQVGKTTLAQSLLESYQDGHPGYYNWDFAEHRHLIRTRGWPSSQRLIVFDELHKLKGWRNLIKGYFDTQKNTHQFMVTGSARLDQLRKSGDSLLGRYHYYRLHPFSYPELKSKRDELEALYEFGGFPEVLLLRDRTELKRWHRARIAKLVREDLREIESFLEIDKIELLAGELPSRVGSPLSVRNLALDLEVDAKTAKRWIEALESLYYCYRLPPFGSKKIVAVKKEQKLYLWDWSQIDDNGARFENMVASHLLKYCHFHEDVYGETMELRYIRDTNKREIDFVVLKNKKAIFAVEAKLKEQALDSSIPYFADRLSIPKFYQVHLTGEGRRINGKVLTCSFAEFCELERMV